MKNKVITRVEAQLLLIAHAEGRERHLGLGQCPDELEGHNARDNDCPVCRALDVLQRLPGSESAKRESVARAICKACNEEPEHLGDAAGNQYRWQDYLDVADSAIAAMTAEDVGEMKAAFEAKYQRDWNDPAGDAMKAIWADAWAAATA